MFFFSTAVVFAATLPPPPGGFTPGLTLDPDCAPGSLDCKVTIPSDVTIGDSILGGASNRALFLDGAGKLGVSDDFVWDDVNRIFEVGDATGTGNGTGFAVDDTVGEVGAISTINPGFEDVMIVGDNGLFKGSSLIHKETATGHQNIIGVGDFTGLGSSTTESIFGYLDAAFDITSLMFANRDELSLQFEDNTSGDESRIILDDSGVELKYESGTTSVDNRVKVDQNGFKINDYYMPVSTGGANIGDVLTLNPFKDAVWETPASGSSLTNTYIGYGNPLNELTGSAAFTFNGTTLFVPELHIGGAYSLPPTDGSPNQIMETDGVGGLTWVNKPNSPVQLSLPGDNLYTPGMGNTLAGDYNNIAFGTDIDNSPTVHDSVKIGSRSGFQATGDTSSTVFIGSNSGQVSGGVQFSNFIGAGSG